MECKKRSWAWVVIVMMVVVCGWSSGSAQSPAQCKEERREAVNACKQVLYGRLPSPQCCERARVSHIQCICPAVTPQRAVLIDVPRAIRLIEGCGRRVPRHFRCGSITTP